MEKCLQKENALLLYNAISKGRDYAKKIITSLQEQGLLTRDVICETVEVPYNSVPYNSTPLHHFSQEYNNIADNRQLLKLLLSVPGVDLFVRDCTDRVPFQFCSSLDALEVFWEHPRFDFSFYFVYPLDFTEQYAKHVIRRLETNSIESLSIHSWLSIETAAALGETIARTRRLKSFYCSFWSNVRSHLEQNWSITSCRRYRKDECLPPPCWTQDITRRNQAARQNCMGAAIYTVWALRTLLGKNISGVVGFWVWEQRGCSDWGRSDRF